MKQVRTLNEIAQSILEVKLDDQGISVTMTPERCKRILNQTRTSIKNHVADGGHTGRKSAIPRIDRYNDHKDWLKDKHPAHWHSYCADHGSHVDHDAYDLYA